MIKEKMNCVSCGAKMKKIKTDYHYLDSGLKNIFLRGIDALNCKMCGEEEIVIQNLEELHDTISVNISSQQQKLRPEEIRFLRTHLGFSGIHFAKTIGVTAETVSRWENGKEKMSSVAERLLRMLILSNAGPFRDYDSLQTYGSIEKKTPQKRLFVSVKNQWKKAA